MNKTELLNTVRIEKAYIFNNATHNNESNEKKALDCCYYLIETYFKNDLDYNITITYKNAVKHLNIGEIVEIAYNHYKHNYITEKHSKGKKDNGNAVYTEIKALLNIHSTAKISEKELKENQGFIIALPEGFYYLTAKTIKENLQLFPYYSYKGNNGYRIYCNTIRKIGKLKIAFVY